LRFGLAGVSGLSRPFPLDEHLAGTNPLALRSRPSRQPESTDGERTDAKRTQTCRTKAVAPDRPTKCAE
jgi:hypothetical protein